MPSARYEGAEHSRQRYTRTHRRKQWSDRPTDRPFDCLTRCMTGRITDKPNDQLTDSSTERLSRPALWIHRSTERSTHGLAGPKHQQQQQCDKDDMSSQLASPDILSKSILEMECRRVGEWARASAGSCTVSRQVGT